MTLILALACKNGIVMASDGQITAMSSSGPVRFPSVKIREIGAFTLWSGSGELGFIQKIEEAIEGFPIELKNAGLEQIRPQIIRAIHSIRAESLGRHRALYGKEEGASFADVLFGDYKGQIPRILHIDRDCNDEWLHEFGYAATGIGDAFAYTILQNYEPRYISVDAGKVLAFRVIGDAIKIGAFGLGEPIDIWSITADDKEVVKSGCVNTTEMAAIRDTCAAWRQAEVETFQNISGRRL